MGLPLLELLAFAMALSNGELRAALKPSDFANGELRKLVAALKGGRHKTVLEWFKTLGVEGKSVANGIVERLRQDAEAERTNGVAKEILAEMVKQRRKGPVLPLLQDGWRYSWWDGCEVWMSHLHDGKWQAIVNESGELKVVRDGRGRIRLFPTAMAAARELERLKVGPGQWRKALEEHEELAT